MDTSDRFRVGGDAALVRHGGGGTMCVQADPVRLPQATAPLPSPPAAAVTLLHPQLTARSGCAWAWAWPAGGGVSVAGGAGGR